MKKYNLAIILFLALQTASFAQSYRSTGSNDSHTGIFINLSLGYASDETIIENYNGEEYVLTGPAILWRLKLGGSVVNNLIFYGVLGGTNQKDPDLDSADVSGETRGVNIKYFDLGVGLAYYFMPYNVYFSTSFARTQSRWETNLGDAVSEPGYSVTLSLGKEWWLSENFGLGLAVIVSFAGLKPGEEIVGSAYASETMNHSYAGIAVSLTYN